MCDCLLISTKTERHTNRFEMFELKIRQLEPVDYSDKFDLD